MNSKDLFLHYLDSYLHCPELTTLTFSCVSRNSHRYTSMYIYHFKRKKITLYVLLSTFLKINNRPYRSFYINTSISTFQNDYIECLQFIKSVFFIVDI